MVQTKILPAVESYIYTEGDGWNEPCGTRSELKIYQCELRFSLK